jgi:prevent-host-death family protein
VVISLTQDIVPVTEFKKNIKGSLAQMHSTGRPIVLTVNGKADAVVMDVAEYERQQRELEVVFLVAEGEADIAAGRHRPARDVLRDLAKRKPRAIKTSR